MKGIVHFLGGIAWTSMSSHAVKAAGEGNPFYFIVGGICGLLPDLLDFRINKFLSKSDIIAVPDPLNPDPDVISAAFDAAISKAMFTKKPVLLKLYTIRLASDRWRRYVIHFNTKEQRIEVEIGEVISTSRNVIDNSDKIKGRKAILRVPCDLRLDYFSEISVEALDGPQFIVSCEGNKGIRIGFIPWHRKWTHGIILSACLGCLGWVIYDRTCLLYTSPSPRDS